jgi:hypothetical protein
MRRGGEGDCLLAASFLMEFSTPFVSLRVILCQLNLKVSCLRCASEPPARA